MKKSHRCPKCTSTKITCVSGNKLNRHSDNWRDPTRLSFARYICRDCGYAEDWYRPEDLQEIEKREEMEMHEFNREF